MRNYFLSFLLLWMMINNGFAQSDSSALPTFSHWTYVGITASPGLSFTGVVNKRGMPDALTFEPYPTYAFGFSIREDFSERWSSQVGVALERNGIRIRYRGGVSTDAFPHLKVPLMVRYRPAIRVGNAPLFLSGGGHFLFAPGSNNGRTITGGSRGVAWTATRYTRFVPALAIGTERRTKRGYLFSLSLTYALGLSNLRDYGFVFQQDGQVVYTTALRNRGTFLGLNCSFFLPPFGYKRLALSSGR